MRRPPRRRPSQRSRRRIPRPPRRSVSPRGPAGSGSVPSARWQVVWIPIRSLTSGTDRIAEGREDFRHQEQLVVQAEARLLHALQELIAGAAIEAAEAPGEGQPLEGAQAKPDPASACAERSRSRNSATGPETSTSRSAAGRPSMPGAIASQIALSVRFSATESPGALFQPGLGGRSTRPTRDQSQRAIRTRSRRRGS